MGPEFLFRMALVDVDAAITGVDAFLAEHIDGTKHVQANSELDTQIRAAELKSVFVGYPEHGVLGVRYNESDAGFAQNRNASSLARLPENRKTLDDIEQRKVCSVVQLVNQHVLGQNNVLIHGLTGQASRSRV